MNKLLGICAIIFVFIGIRVQAADLELELIELRFDGVSCPKVGDYFYKDNTKIAIKDVSFDFATVPYKAKLTIKLDASPQLELEGELKEMKPTAISNLASNYSPKESWADFLRRTKANVAKVSQKFKWSDEESNDLGGLGSPKLIFSNKKLSHEAKFHDTPAFDCSNLDHQTRMQLCYDFDNKAPTYSHDIFVLHHTAKAASLAEIKYLDNQECLNDLKFISYTTVPEEYKDWAQANNLPVQEYAQLQNNNRDPEVLALDVDESALDKYYRQENQIEQNGSEYIWSNGLGQLFMTKKIESTYCEQKYPQEIGIDFKFCDANDTAENFKCCTLEKTDNEIAISSKYFHLQGEFKKGYYRLNNTTNTLDGVEQLWIEMPSSDGRVSIIINNVKTDNKWMPLPGFTSVVPEPQENQIIIDLSSVLHVINNNKYSEIKDYLVAACWIDKKTPVIKYKFASRTLEEKERARTRLNQLIIDMGVIELDLDEGIILEARGASCLWTPAQMGFYATKKKPCSLLFNYKDILEFITKNNAVNTIHISPGPLFQPSKIGVELLANNTQIKRIVLRKLVCEAGSKIRLDKLMPKIIGLQILKISNLSISASTFSQCLLNKASTLEHLDLCGIRCLHESGDIFIEAVKHMSQLRSINLIDSGLSNFQTYELAIALKDKKNLIEVAIEMPYFVHSSIDCSIMCVKILREESPLSILWFPVLSPYILFGTTIADIAGFEGFCFSDTRLHLSQIANLKSLKLKLGSSQYFSCKEFNESRKNRELNPVEIEFVK